MLPSIRLPHSSADASLPFALLLREEGGGFLRGEAGDGGVVAQALVAGDQVVGVDARGGGHDEVVLEVAVHGPQRHRMQAFVVAQRHDQRKVHEHAHAGCGHVLNGQVVAR